LYSFKGLKVDALVTLDWIYQIILENTPRLSYGTSLDFISLIGMSLYFGSNGYLFALVNGCFFNMGLKIKL
jgi:hypothetical protein